jgi:secondary thiamine-phosphate synthase enzyme
MEMTRKTFMALHPIKVRTQQHMQMVDITTDVERIVATSTVRDGTVLLYVAHTTCGITIQENADPGVQHDMLLVLAENAPREDRRYRHIEDNSASHVQSSTMGFTTFLFVHEGTLVRGRWQAIYLAEFDGPRERTVYVKVVPDQ